MGFHHKHPSCHVGPVEVVKNLFCGSESESLIMASTRNRIHALIPLDSLDSAVWDTGFRGEILYYPIEDYKILPDDVLSTLVAQILDRLHRNQKVGLFCLGGHGRTGYVAAVVLGRLGHSDPIAFLRKHYCRKAVESNDQIQHIADVLGRPELARRYKTYASNRSSRRITLFDLEDERLFGGFSHFSEVIAQQERCGECGWFSNGMCRLYTDFHVEEDTIACCDFTA